MEKSNISSAMKVTVNLIPEEGLTEHFVCDAHVLDLNREDIQVNEPIEVSAHEQYVDGHLVIRAKVRAVLDMTCGRCLEPFKDKLYTDPILSYEVSQTEVVDITDDVRQEIILAYPIIPICAKDCKGLCFTCGQNLNQASCEHQDQKDS